MLYFHEKTPDGFNARLVDDVRCYTKTIYQTVTIVKHALLGRTLYLNDHFQSDDSFQAEYSQTMVRLAFEDADVIEVKRILICGSGPGGLNKASLQIFPNLAKIVAVELDGEAYNLYKKHLFDWGEDNFCSGMVEQRIGNIFNLLCTFPTNHFDSILWDIDADTIPKNDNPFAWASHLIELLHVLKSGGSFVATAGFISERAETDPYIVFINELKKAFPEGKLHEFTRMNWNFFSARKP